MTEPRDRQRDFEASYAGTPPWDIGRPQPAFRALAEAGAWTGPLLDVGCGTGEHVLLAAEHGLDATGIDLAPTAVRLAEAKRAERGGGGHFLVHDALDLPALGRAFATVVDCGLFHVFDDADRARFLASLTAATGVGSRYAMLCFSDREPPGWGPRRVTAGELEEAFAEGWRLDSVEPSTMEVTLRPEPVETWLVQATRRA